MGNISWYINRLKAMNVPEVCWRISQKLLQKREARMAQSAQADVTGRLLYPELEKEFGARMGTIVTRESLPLDRAPLSEVFDGTAVPDIHLLGGYVYTDYEDRWHAGFNTANDWPMVQSYSLAYKQCDAVGDARINWELNRCYQFAILARLGDVAKLDSLLDSWARQNPWLMGISWTSVMEVAIRAIQWTTAACYLSGNTDVKAQAVKRRLECGALNMAKYVSLHYSRYSSANNHLLVEALCLLYVGLAFGRDNWQKLGADILDEQLPLQNFPDGVNKEMSLHYQGFVMEAYALALIVSPELRAARLEKWRPMLEAMCLFVAWSTVSGTVMEWGDDDEGKILDLCGGASHHDYYGYLLGLYRSLGLYTPVADDALGMSFMQGGYTFARSTDHRLVLGIDHAPLGFGTIAAHGHADALSLQVIYDGKPVLTDPGTYIYHCQLPMRNLFRQTVNHNTLCVGDRDQSEMLGAFLWGRKATATLHDVAMGKDGSLDLTVSHDGYAPIVHERALQFDGCRRITVTDRLTSRSPYTLTYILGADMHPSVVSDTEVALECDGRIVCTLAFSAQAAEVKIETALLSTDYGIKRETRAVRVRGNGKEIKTEIKFI